MDEATSEGGFAGDQGRRDALKKLGVGGAGVAAAWIAPSMLSVTSAAAQSGPGVPPQGCVGCGANLVANASFEAPLFADGGGIPTGWTVSTNYGFVLPYSWVPDFIPPSVAAGDQFGLYQGEGAFEQTFPVDPSCVGKGYDFSFWAISFRLPTDVALTFVGSSGPAVVAVTVPGTPDPAPTYPFTQFTSSGTIPAGTTGVTATFPCSVQLAVDLVSFIVGCS